MKTKLLILAPLIALMVSSAGLLLVLKRQDSLEQRIAGIESIVASSSEVSSRVVTVTPTGTSAPAGETVGMKAMPAAGYRFERWPTPNSSATYVAPGAAFTWLSPLLLGVLFVSATGFCWALVKSWRPRAALNES